nr:alpha/beta family hydrolase [Alkalilimnicola ehrlichii]
MASLVADELGVAGLLCLGYPFHPPGKPDRLRIEHLQSLATPALILQGERDAFGRRDEVPAYPLSEQVRIAWVPDGDHSFKPRKSAATTERDNLAFAVETAAAFVAQL